MNKRESRYLPADNRGISLVELMVVLVVVAIGVLALSGVQTRSSTDVYSTGRHSRAVHLAQMRMEVARGAGFALAQSDSGTTDGFAWRTVVDSADVGLRRVRVTVAWTDQGDSRDVRLNNLLAMR